MISAFPAARTFVRTLVLLALGFIACGCKCADRAATSYPLEGHTRPRPAVFTRAATGEPSATTGSGSQPSDLTQQARASVGRNCAFGMPTRISPRLGPSHFVYREWYVAEHSDDDHIPLWVAERVEFDRWHTFLGLGKVGRLGMCFREDPSLPDRTGAQPQDYDHSDYDPGHHAASANQAADKARMLDTFYLSNNAPQAKTLNRGPWLELEKQIRAYTGDPANVAFVVSGGFFYDPREEEAQTADGKVDVTYLGEEQSAAVNRAGVSLPKRPVAVPTHFFKVVLWGGTRDGAPVRSTVLVFRNSPVPRPGEPFTGEGLESHAVSLGWLRTRTGIDFIPLAPTDVRQRLEADTHFPGWMR